MTTTLEPAGVEWRRVSTKLITAEIIGSILFWGLVIAAALVGNALDWRLFGLEWGMLAAAGLAFVLLIGSMIITVRRIRAIGYQLRDDDLVVRRGIMFRRILSVPYGRMQLVDINRGPVMRWLGLSELKLVTAAPATYSVTIPGLTEADAERLRDHIVELAESRRAGL